MRILFYMDWPLAMTYLLPVYRFLKEKHPDWDFFFSTSDGASRDLIDRKSLPFGSDDYDFAFTCDGLSACYSSNKGKKICLTHGLASKGQEFSKHRAGAYRDYPGYLVCPGNHYAELLREMNVPEEKIVVAGLTKFDGLTWPLPPLRTENPRILYAPTFNPELSSIPILKDDIYDLPNLLIHLHNFTKASTRDVHQEMRSHYPGLRYDDDDITPVLANADIVIADFGSTVVEAIALGKQVIQVQNPKYTDFYTNRRSLTVSEMSRLPEIFFPSVYSSVAVNMDGVKEAVRCYSSLIGPYQQDRGVVVNIGRASETIYERIIAK